MLFPILGPSSLPVVAAQPDRSLLRWIGITEQLLRWIGITDAERKVHTPEDFTTIKR